YCRKTISCLPASIGINGVPTQIGPYPRDSLRSRLAAAEVFSSIQNEVSWRGSVRAATGGTPAKALIDWLASLESGIHRMPVLDGGLTHAPAEQYDVVVKAEWKIEQAGLKILYLDADGVDLRNVLAHFLQMRFHLRANFPHFRRVHLHPAGKVNPPRQLGEIRLHRLRRALALNRLLQQRFQNWQQRLRFIERKGLHRRVLFLAYEKSGEQGTETGCGE